MLDINDLTAGYGKSEVLRGISINIAPGEVVTIIGANGAGKSTTLKTLCGLVKATSGSIRFQGADITTSRPMKSWNRHHMVPEGRQLFLS